MSAAPTLVQRAPRMALRPFVRVLWASSGSHGGAAPAGAASALVPAAAASAVVPAAAASAVVPAAAASAVVTHRELMLPAGTCHVAIRLGDRPVRLFADEHDAVGGVVGAAVVGGPRAASYLRDATSAGPALGVEIEPGAVPLLLGVSAADVAHHHVPLEAVWGPSVESLRERLAATDDLEERLAIVESELLARVPRARGIHPAVAFAVRRLEVGATVNALVGETGYSARHLGALFHDGVGLAPKVFARVRRFTHALDLSRAGAAGAPTPWASVAAAAGYADQAHLAREFRAIAGVSPGEYRSLAPAEARHVPVAADVRPRHRAR